MSQSDPISSLHKMSPTAGAASQEYVAINSVAVASVILGLLALFALMVKVLLVIPLAGIVCALVAMRQIRNSGGTQTGIGVASFGLVLSLAISAVTLAQARKEYVEEQRDGEQINAVLEEFGRDMAQAFPGIDKPIDTHALALAYQQFTPKGYPESFQDKYPPDIFENRFIGVTRQFGPLVGAHWNGICHFAGVAEDDHSSAETLAVFVFAHEEVGPAGTRKHSEIRYNCICRNIPRLGWKIDALPELFSPPRTGVND